MDIVTASTLTLTTLATSSLILLFDEQQRFRLTKLLHLVPALCVALPVVWYVAYDFTGDMSFLGDASDALDRWHSGFADQNPLPGFVMLLPTFLVHILLILLVPVLIGLTYLFGALAALYLVGTLLYLVPTFLLVPALALRNIARGTLIVLSLPFRGARELVFIASQPSAVRDIKRELARPQRTAKDAARFVNDTLEAEVKRAVKVRWWRPRFRIFDSLRHYKLLAEHIQTLTRVGQETEAYLKNKARSDDHGKGS